MSKANRKISLSALFLVLGLGLVGWAIPLGGSTDGAQEAESAANGPRPVDDDMHHFMEYVFQPNYKRLKTGMANEPKDKNGWKAIKGDALTLAEGANLLLMRAPEEDADQWRTLSVAVRTSGSDLYQAARKSNYAVAREAYVKMLKQCNACHVQFADGEHQLRP